MSIPTRIILSGPYLNSDGYYVVYVEEDNGFRYVTPFHRYIWEEYHKKKVPKNCVIHHKDGNKKNNSIENLVVMTRTAHSKLHFKLRKRRKLARRRMAAIARRNKKDS